MAEYTYETTIEGNKTDLPFNGFWKLKFVLNLDKISAIAWQWKLDAFIFLGSNNPDRVYKAQNHRELTDELCAYMYFGLTDTYESPHIRKQYGPITSNDGWVPYNSISGTFNITGRKVATAYAYINLGWGSSLGTGTGVFVETAGDLVKIELTGLTNPTVTPPVMVGNTSSSISSTFDVDWGYDEETRIAKTRIYNASGNLVQELLTRTATFTGLQRYTPYYVEAYAENGYGSATSEKVLMYTKAEAPTVGAPIVSNYGITTPIQGIASVTVTPGRISDNGGKAIESIETLIRGGQYGAALISIGTGNLDINVTDLLPNTEYQVITKVSNGDFESYSEYTIFTTLGNPPEFEDIYVANTTLTNGLVQWFAKYEYNSEYKSHFIEWRYYGDTEWNRLSDYNNLIETDLGTKKNNNIEYRVTVTDIWDRSTTSSILSYNVLSMDSVEGIGDISYMENEDDTYTITVPWDIYIYSKLNGCLVLGNQGQYQASLAGDPSTIELDETGLTFKTKPYKNKFIPITFTAIINFNNINFALSTMVPAKEYEKNIANMVKDDGTISKYPMFVIGSNGKMKQLRKHDLIKLSKTMRYIDIDSRGTFEEKIGSFSNDNLIVGDFAVSYLFDLSHISRNLFQVQFKVIAMKTLDGSTKTIRNNNVSILFNEDGPLNSRLEFNVPVFEVGEEFKDIDFMESGYLLSDIEEDGKIKLNFTIKISPEFNHDEYQEVTIELGSAIEYDLSDITENHLVNLKVFDKEGIDRAAGLKLTLTDGTEPIVYNNGDPTSGNLDSSSFIYSENGLPLRLDLGQEYEIDRMEIQRRILAHGNSYIRNYIIGRNEDKEICYIFFDSQREGEYIEEYKTFTIN